MSPYSIVWLLQVVLQIRLRSNPSNLFNSWGDFFGNTLLKGCIEKNRIESILNLQIPILKIKLILEINQQIYPNLKKKNRDKNKTITAVQKKVFEY